MRAKRAKNFRSRGGPKSRWGWTQNFGDGGDRSPWGGDNPLMGVGPPHPPPILVNPVSRYLEDINEALITMKKQTFMLYEPVC